jgi:hypothetical protein
LTGTKAYPNKNAQPSLVLERRWKLTPKP